jgi:hypothetical protein
MRAKQVRTEPEIEWADYPRIEPGQYPAYCRSWVVYRYPKFRRWTCLLHFDVLSGDQQVIASIPLWLNLGGGETAHAGRGGRFFEEWIKANGGPPKRGNCLPASVFVRRMATVLVRDAKSPSPYSVVARVVAWETGHGNVK